MASRLLRPPSKESLQDFRWWIRRPLAVAEAVAVVLVVAVGIAVEIAVALVLKAQLPGLRMPALQPFRLTEMHRSLRQAVVETVVVIMVAETSATETAAVTMATQQVLRPQQMRRLTMARQRTTRQARLPVPRAAEVALSQR